MWGPSQGDLKGMVTWLDASSILALWNVRQRKWKEQVTRLPVGRYGWFLNTPVTQWQGEGVDPVLS